MTKQLIGALKRSREDLIRQGYALLDVSDRDQVPRALQSARAVFGDLISHPKATANHLVPVHFRAELNAKDCLINEVSEALAAHTDGAFLQDPPAVVGLDVPISDVAPRAKSGSQSEA